MFIKNLKILKGDIAIRDINFKKGINLIIDETPEELRDIKKSGNSVGKTTVLRLIDYCLGGDGENIYTDSEFKDKNKTKVEDFLKKEKILISVILVDNLEDESSRRILIERNFLEGDEKVCRINGESYPDLKNAFHPKLKELIFNSVYKKPTFRQIISRNVRDEKNKLLNAIKTLHPTTKPEEYECLYLFWLGIELKNLDEKQELERKKTIEKNLQVRLKKDSSYSEIIQSLIIVDKNIEDLEKKRTIFVKNENFEKDLNEVNTLKSKLNRFSTQLTQLELRKELIIESREDLENEISKIDEKSIAHIYKEAQALIPNLQKTFDETLNFHNQMIKEKIGFIIEELPRLDREIILLKNKISSLLAEEKSLLEKIKQVETVEQYEDMITKLNSLHETKGKLEEQKRFWEQSQKELNYIESRLREINDEIDSQEAIIQDRIAKFNEYFSAMSDKLYGEKFILSSDKNKKGYELNISSIEGNLGTGKKKGLIVAFDFAYVRFADTLGIKCLHFILHDQMENVHNNQITNILTEIINEVNCQYIIPVLKDKLPNTIDVNLYRTLTLSQTEKLFRIP